MATTVIDFSDYMLEGASDAQKHKLAQDIGDKWTQYKANRQAWEDESLELRNYLFATDTRTTQNRVANHKNSTTLPKLTHIRDNLYSNYVSALFPNSEWLVWEAANEASASYEVRQAIEGLMRDRLRASKFESVISQIILDYIDFGNCFAKVIWVDETELLNDGNKKSGYIGPKLIRISPYDIVFDNTAPSFEKAPKILRTLTTLDALLEANKSSNKLLYDEEVIELARERRINYSTLPAKERNKIVANTIDGFQDNDHYLLNSSTVELLEFYGDIYDTTTNTLHKDVRIAVLDRTYIIRNERNSEFGSYGKLFHVGWRKRPDNLYAQGPLNNLVGMQFRIDHLENLKADAFEKIANPITKVKGEVSLFRNLPGEKVFLGEEGEISYLYPDPAVLSADSQIKQLELRMEEYAGAPREAMGFRTPGEKTAFEVQTLDNRANRVFQTKINQFEMEFLEPIVNTMLSLIRENFPVSAFSVPVFTDKGAKIFKDISKEDIEGLGNLYPKGARHFQVQANLLQNLLSIFNSALGSDPLVRSHFSGKNIAKLIDEVVGLDRYSVYTPNAAITESLELERLKQVSAERLQTEAQTPIDPSEEPLDL